MANTPKERALIIDTDGGADDLVAICALRNTKSTNIPILTTVGGLSNNPARTARLLKKELIETDVIAGQRSKINEEYSVEWLEENRKKINKIMTSAGVAPSSDGEPCTGKTIDGIANFLMNQPDQSVDLMCLGPMTNVASWIDCEKTRTLLESKVAEIWIMGGNEPTQNLESQAEYNFYNDPTASAKVIQSKILSERMHLVTATLCKSLTPPSSEKWEAFVRKGQNNKGIIGQVLKYNNGWDDLKYDPLCLFAYANPNERKVKTLKLKMSLREDPPYGSLLLQPESSDGSNDDTFKLKFVTDVTVDSEDNSGFLQWLTKAVENSPYD